MVNFGVRFVLSTARVDEDYIVLLTLELEYSFRFSSRFALFPRYIAQIFMPVSAAAWKPMLIIGGLSYLMGVVVGYIRVDLTGSSELARYYYCEFEPEVADAHIFSNLPLIMVVLLSAVTLFQKMVESLRSGSEMVLLELTVAMAMLLVCVPLYFKCIQLVNSGCSLSIVSDVWPVHKNLLMFHVCVLLILAGTAFGELWILMRDLHRVVKRSKKPKVQ